MPELSEPLRHEEVNAVARALRKEYPTLPFEAVRRSVLRNWPNAEACRREVHAKAFQPCIIGVQIVMNQHQYIDHLQRTFSTTNTTLPYLRAAHRTRPTGCESLPQWGNVADLLSDPATPRAYWIDVTCPIGVIPTEEKYESLYKRVILEEGVRDVLGFASACDGLVPFCDYISMRRAGGSPAEVAARMNFGDLAAEAHKTEERMRGDSDADDMLMIAWDRERLEGFVRTLERAANTSALTVVKEVANQPLEVLRARLHEAGELDLVTEVDDIIAERDRALGAPVEKPRFYRELNLFGNNPSTAIPWRQNKAGMHRRLRDCGLAHIRSVEADDAASAAARMAEAGIDYPIVVKPVSGAGSEFVTLCYTKDDLAVAFAVCDGVLTTQRTTASSMVVEEYIAGPEYVVNVVSFEGRHVVTDMWRSWKYPKANESTRLRYSVESRLKERAAKDASVRAPKAVTSTSLLYDRLEFVQSLADLSETSEERQVVAYTLAATTALGIVNGCSHSEVRVDARPGSSRAGQPILIELNPRMQGDVPRATQLVGYDQYMLLYYLSAVAAACETASATPHSPRTPTARTPGEGGRLPWPPVPTLYRSLQTDLAPGEEPITRHVVFLTSPAVSVLWGQAALRIMDMRTFLRGTRGSVFIPPKPGYVTTLTKTVDLYTSPGACVFEGRERDIREDTAELRAMEQAEMPEEARQLLLRATSEAKTIRQREEALRAAEGVQRDCEEEEFRLRHAYERARDEFKVMADRKEGDIAPFIERLEEASLVHDEARRRAQAVRDECLGMSSELMILKKSLQQLIRSGLHLVRLAEPPPLYFKMSDYELMWRLDLGTQFPLRTPPPRDAAEEFTMMKSPQLRRAFEAAGKDAGAEPQRSDPRPYGGIKWLMSWEASECSHGEST